MPCTYFDPIPGAEVAALIEQQAEREAERKLAKQHKEQLDLATRLLCGIFKARPSELSDLLRSREYVQWNRFHGKMDAKRERAEKKIKEINRLEAKLAKLKGSANAVDKSNSKD